MGDGQAKRYAVMGHPVAHSKSPLIHRWFAEQFGYSIEYRAIDVQPGTFVQAVREFRASGGLGLNVTIPFKTEAWELAGRRSGRADLAGAVNTLKFADGEIYGDNTDGVGLVRDLALNHDCPLFDKRILVIGAGGAVRGILGPILEQGAAAVIVANRTVVKAEALARVFSVVGPVQPRPFEALAGERFDIVINGTAASLEGEVPAVPGDIFAPGALAYDLMYADQPTAFMRWAGQHGAGAALDGLGMLVEQAAESFLIWWGRRPETAPVIRSLRPRR